MCTATGIAEDSFMAVFLSCRITHLCVIFEQNKKRNWKETVLLNVAECGRSYCAIVNIVGTGSTDGSRCSVGSLVSISSSNLSQDTSFPRCTRTPDARELVGQQICNGLES